MMQDVVAGDGTTSVVVICGALLKKAQELLEKGIHPTVISDSFNKAASKACEVGAVICSSSEAYCITSSCKQEQQGHLRRINVCGDVMPC